MVLFMEFGWWFGWGLKLACSRVFSGLISAPGLICSQAEILVSLSEDSFRVKLSGAASYRASVVANSSSLFGVLWLSGSPYAGFTSFAGGFEFSVGLLGGSSKSFNN